MNRAKRYTKEWLTYGVYPDYTEGEYSRNGNYCIPQQGRIYASANMSMALTTQDILERNGNNSLSLYTTTGGIYGTEVST